MALALLLLSLHLPLLTSSSSSSSDFEEDFVYSFLHKPEKLHMTSRLEKVEHKWVKETPYQNAVGISVENWTNQKLEYPEDFIAEGGRDQWYKPMEVPRHTRDLGLLAYGVRGSLARGSLCYLVEDSWPICYICLGWESQSPGVHVLLAITSKALDYDSLLEKELNGLLMKDKMRFYKATDQYVVAVTAREEGSGVHLVLSVIPQRLDVWAWEKYYKQEEVKQKIEVEVLPTELPQTAYTAAREEDESEPGIFSRKELLTRGEGVLRWQGNRTEKEVVTASGGSVGVGVVVENWSSYTLTQPQFVPNYGVASVKLPPVAVGAGMVELAVLRQEAAGTGVSGVLRWRVGTSDTILSLMISAPFSLHLYSPWLAAGLTSDEVVPDFSAMYSGTPDSSWFVRAEMGHSLEFTNGELILVVTSDSGSHRPIVRLAVVPRDAKEVAPSITHRLEGRPGQFPRPGKEGDRSAMSLRSSASQASQCHCPCMGGVTSPVLCSLLRLLLLLLPLLLNNT